MAQQQRFDWWAGPPVVRTAGGPPAPRKPSEPHTPQAPHTPQPSQSQSVDSAEVYRMVQRSAAFGEIRRGYRGFVFPATAVFLGWYLAYVVAQAAAPGLMRHRIAGPLNVAWLLGLLQFASTFLLTFLYARNARTKRDRAALELRWDTQDALR